MLQLDCSYLSVLPVWYSKSRMKFLERCRGLSPFNAQNSFRSHCGPHCLFCSPLPLGNLLAAYLTVPCTTTPLPTSAAALTLTVVHQSAAHRPTIRCGDVPRAAQLASMQEKWRVYLLWAGCEARSAALPACHPQRAWGRVGGAYGAALCVQGPSYFEE